MYAIIKWAQMKVGEVTIVTESYRWVKCCVRVYVCMCKLLNNSAAKIRSLRHVKEWVQLFCVRCLNYPWGGCYHAINRKAVVFM